MKKQVILFLLSIVIIGNSINADIMAELAKRDRKNPIRIAGDSHCVLFAKDGYLHTEYWEDGFGVPSIVTEYIYLRPDKKDLLFWYNFSVPNHLLVRQ